MTYSSEDEGYENRIPDVGEKGGERASETHGEAVSVTGSSATFPRRANRRINVRERFKATRSGSTDLGRHRPAVLGGGRAEQLGVAAEISHEEETSA